MMMPWWGWGGGWGVLAMILWPLFWIGLIILAIYLVVKVIEGARRARPSSEAPAHSQPCPSCQRPVSPDFLACPYCRYELKPSCKGCGKPLSREWRSCPYCSTPIA